MKTIANKPKLNIEWHHNNIMPKNPTIDQRIEWNLKHAMHCGCRKISKKLLEEMKKRNIKLPL